MHQQLLYRSVSWFLLTGTAGQEQLTALFGSALQSVSAEVRSCIEGLAALQTREARVTRALMLLDGETSDAVLEFLHIFLGIFSVTEEVASTRKVSAALARFS